MGEGSRAGSASNWKVPLEDCDVIDKAGLSKFRKLADAWIDMLNGDVENSITKQIMTMMSDDAMWRSLNEARRLARGKAEVATSGIVGSLLDRGYLAGQVIAISRLLDKGAKNKKRQVNSLRRLVDEICCHRNLLTREIFICRDGLPYSFETVRQKYPLPTAEEGAGWLDAGQDGWMMSELLHKQFDRMSGKSANERSRNDKIEDAIFERLDARLKDPVFEAILALRNKSIAHAADRLSRSEAASLRDGMKLVEIGTAHYLLVGAYQAISSVLLNQPWLSSPIPTPLSDIFENLEKPIIAAPDIDELHEFWRRHANERSDWMSAACQEIIPYQ